MALAVHSEAVDSRGLSLSVFTSLFIYFCDSCIFCSLSSKYVTRIGLPLVFTPNMSFFKLQLLSFWRHSHVNLTPVRTHIRLSHSICTHCYWFYTYFTAKDDSHCVDVFLIWIAQLIKLYFSRKKYRSLAYETTLWSIALVFSIKSRLKFLKYAWNSKAVKCCQW